MVSLIFGYSKAVLINTAKYVIQTGFQEGGVWWFPLIGSPMKTLGSTEHWGITSRTKRFWFFGEKVVRWIVTIPNYLSKVHGIRLPLRTPLQATSFFVPSTIFQRRVLRNQEKPNQQVMDGSLLEVHQLNHLRLEPTKHFGWIYIWHWTSLIHARFRKLVFCYRILDISIYIRYSFNYSPV